jgi:serine/threonine protein kinase
MRACCHPNVVNIIDIFEDDYSMYIVQELMDGGSDLYDYMKKNPTLTEQDVQKIFW